MAKEFFVYSSTKAKFEAQVTNGTVDATQIGIIGDTAEVWINGQYLPFAMPLNAHSTTPRLQQYALRASTDGSVVTDVIASVNKIVGKAVSWNQMFDTVAEKTMNNITISFDSSTNEVVITNNSRTSNLTATTIFGQIGSQTLIANHKYLITSTHPYAGLGITLNGSTSYYYPVNSVFTARDSWYAQVALTSSLLIAGSNADVSVLPSGKTRRIRMALFDLTEMFGVGNEPASYGEFYELYPEPYYAPSASTIVGTKVLSIDTPVYNLWNADKAIPGVYIHLTGEFRETDYHRARWVSAIVPILPDMAYYLVDVANRSECMPCVFFDKDMRYIGYGGPQSLDVTLHNLSGEIVTPSNAAYMAVMVYKSSSQDFSKTACVSVSSRRNGDTESYTEQKVNLDLEDIHTVFPYGLLSVVEDGVVYEDELGEGYALKYVDYDVNDDDSISNLRRMKITNSSGVEEYKPEYHEVNTRLWMTWRVRRGATEKVTLSDVSAPFRASISYALDVNDLLPAPLLEDVGGGTILTYNDLTRAPFRSTKTISQNWTSIRDEQQNMIPTCQDVFYAIQRLRPAAVAPAMPKQTVSSTTIHLIANTVVEYSISASVSRYMIASISKNVTDPNAYDDYWIFRGSVNAGTTFAYQTNMFVIWRDGIAPQFTEAGYVEIRLREFGDDNLFLGEWIFYPLQ